MTIQLVAYACTFASMWFYGRKRRLGPVLGVLGLLPWGTLAWNAHVPSLIIFSLICAALHLRTLWLWRTPSAEPKR